tara:strand:- start:605 stop:799 length:195 start_codon:yes stop_codon:yes gene_type:complete
MNLDERLRIAQHQNEIRAISDYEQQTLRAYSEIKNPPTPKRQVSNSSRRIHRQREFSRASANKN